MKRPRISVLTHRRGLTGKEVPAVHESSTKRCSKCGEVKPLSEFHRMARSADGRRPDCKDCVRQARATPEARHRHAENARRRRAADPEGQREYVRAYARRPGVQEHANERQRLRRLRPEAREADKAAQARNRDKVRKQVFDHYGRQCACCGATGDLTIDHVNGDGAEHRQQLFGKQQGGHVFYRWLVRDGFPEGYGPLCQPCNSSKRDGPACRLDHSRRPQSVR